MPELSALFGLVNDRDDKSDKRGPRMGLFGLTNEGDDKSDKRGPRISLFGLTNDGDDKNHDRGPRMGLFAAVVFILYICYGLAIPWLEDRNDQNKAAARIIALRASLSTYENATVKINDALRAGMDRDPALDRIQVAFLQMPPAPTSLPTLRWSITHAITKPGHVVGAMASDLQASDWADYFPSMLAGKCAPIDIASMASKQNHERIREMHIAAIFVCPLVTPRGELVGGLFGSWDEGSPTPPNLTATMARMQDVAAKIAAAVPLSGG